MFETKGKLAGKKVLVTGADGFIGSHLVERLIEEGAQVRAFCIYNSLGSLGWLDELSATEAFRSGQVETVLGDIRDARMMEEACKGIDVVFHLAALISIPYSYSAPESYVDTNVRGTLNALEGARRHGVSRFIHTSTSEVYGTPKDVPIRETHPLKPQSPYAATKVGADQMALAYHLSFEVPAMVLRPFNTYGPRQSTRAVLPTILSQLLAGKEELSLGRLDPKRDLTFVSDTVDGFIRAAVVPGIEGETIQLGTGSMVSIGDLVEMAKKVTGNNARVVADEKRMRPDGSEVLVLLSDPSYAKEKLGWTPQTSLESGLRQTTEWMKKNRSRYSPDQFRL